MSSTHNIKELKPRKNGRYKQGYINPKGCKKLFESQSNNPIIFRSSYERKFIKWLESSPQVVHWGSECVSIPYMSPLDGKWHTYYPDYIMELDDGMVVLVEIKPRNETVQPPSWEPRDSYRWTTYVKNMAKWDAAMKFCKQHNMKFKIFTEVTINKL